MLRVRLADPPPSSNAEAVAWDNCDSFTFNSNSIENESLSKRFFGERDGGAHTILLVDESL
jgi:hypothetical protein